MKKVISILLALIILIPSAVHAVPASECAMSMNDAYTIQGGAADVTVCYDFTDTVHALCFFICFPIPLTVESVAVDPAVRSMDGVMITVDADEDGQVAVGILCAQEGLTGTGELMTVRFHFADYYANGWESVDLIVTEAYHEPISGESYPIPIDRARSNVYVHTPTADDVLAILHRVHSPYTCPELPWMDLNGDGAVSAVDALLLLRRILGIS